jgi:hypothetical protein
MASDGWVDRWWHCGELVPLGYRSNSLNSDSDLWTIT